MELKHLRYLIAISDETTFVRAAERLHLAQPALSRQIHKFEKEIGARVFVRGRTGVTLTAAGEICLEAARDILERVERAANSARMANAGRSGDVFCAIAAGVSTSDAPIHAATVQRNQRRTAEGVSVTVL